MEEWKDRRRKSTDIQLSKHPSQHYLLRKNITWFGISGSEKMSNPELRKNWFTVYLHDYIVTVEKIIPACIQSQDEGLVDDLHHALDNRSRLEEELKRSPQLEKYRSDIKWADKALLAQRDTLLEIIGDEICHYRTTFSPPTSHWWWYLDESNTYKI